MLEGQRDCVLSHNRFACGRVRSDEYELTALKVGHSLLLKSVELERKLHCHAGNEFSVEIVERKAVCALICGLAVRWQSMMIRGCWLLLTWCLYLSSEPTQN